jgi:hypothetical protein
MRRQREQREREMDPALRAFREYRFQIINRGGAIEEDSLSIQLWWIAARSAWGRWQTAQNHLPAPTGAEPPRITLRITESYVLDLLVSGRLVARAQREDDGAWEELSPYFWTTKFLQLECNPISLYRLKIPLASRRIKNRFNWISLPPLRWSQIKAIFPEHDDETDAETARLRSLEQQ